MTETSSKIEAAGAPLPETVFSAGSQSLTHALRELWRYRDLLRAFIARDIAVRYRQTVLGVLWVLLQPLLTSGVLALLFARLGTLKIGGGDAVLFFMAALVPWTCFASGVQQATTAMEAHASLISKAYFPRMVIPSAFVLGTLLDFAINFAVLAVFAAALGRPVGLLLALVPLLLAIQVCAALGLGLFFGILNAQYRDVRHVIPFLLQVGMLLTVPLALASWPPPVREILAFNPLAGVAESYRAALSGSPLDGLLLLKSGGVAALTLLGGAWFFAARERNLADIL